MPPGLSRGLVLSGLPALAVSGREFLSDPRPDKGTGAGTENPVMDIRSIPD